MPMSDTTEQRHAAVGPFAGFFYQWHYFMLRALSMNHGESVSFENKDDVDTETGEGYSYYQLKHTVKATKTHIVNLPLRDSDWWKSISVWLDIIKGKGSDEAQRDFIAKTDFTLVTNKTVISNDLYNKIEAFRCDSSKYNNLECCLKQLYDETANPKNETGSTTKEQIAKLKDYPLRRDFLLKVYVETLSDSDIVERIKEEIIEGKYVDEGKVEDAYNAYIGEMDKDAVEVLSNGNALTYSRKEFQVRFQHCFTAYRKVKITFCKFERDATFDIQNSTFIRQLVDIDDVGYDEADIIYDYVDRRLDYDKSMSQSVRKHEISQETRNEIENRAFKYWRQQFRFYNHTHSDEETHKTQARQLLNDVRGKNLKYEEQEFDDYQSHGCFYTLSDGTNPRIGWHIDWEQKYKQVDDGQAV